MSKKATINPWLTMWTEPRRTIRYIGQSNPNYCFYLLSGIYGFAMLLQAAQNFSLGQVMAPSMIVLLALIFSIPIGVLSFSVMGGLILWCGKWIGGKGTFFKIRASLAWANITNIANILMWLLLLVMFGGRIFFNTFPGTPLIGYELGIVLTVFMVQLIAAVWSFVLLLKGLGEAQGFSIWKALLNIVLPFLIIFIVLWILGWILNLSLAIALT